jgi:DNA-binding Lrp family transcriptional regulator
MVEAYVLVQTEIGAAARVLAEMRRIPAVTLAVTSMGPYDVLVKVVAPDIHSLGKLAVGEIQAVPGVSRTMTCPVVNL